MCLSCVCHEPPPILTLIPKQAGPPRLALFATLGPVFANKAGIARRIECRDRQRRSQHLDEPAYPADRQTWVVARAPRDLLLLVVSPCAGPCAGRSAGNGRALSRAASRVRLGPLVARGEMLGAKSAGGAWPEVRSGASECHWQRYAQRRPRRSIIARRRWLATEAVYAENQNPAVVVMKSAQDGK